MPTSQLVSINGSLALPRLEPLSHIPPPFGQDWALQRFAANGSGAAHAAYAALFRTFCLDNPAFLAAWRWDRPQTAAAQARAHAARSEQRKTAAQRPSPAASQSARPAAASRPAAPPRPSAPPPVIPRVRPKPGARRRPWKQWRGDALKLGVGALFTGLVTWWLAGPPAVQRPAAPADAQLAAVAPADAVAPPTLTMTEATPPVPQPAAAKSAARVAQPKPKAAAARTAPPYRAAHNRRPARTAYAQAAPSGQRGDHSVYNVETLVRMEAAARMDATRVPDLGIPVDSTAWPGRLAHQRLTEAAAQFASRQN